jgi:hypothetical protein
VCQPLQVTAGATPHGSSHSHGPCSTSCAHCLLNALAACLPQVRATPREGGAATSAGCSPGQLKRGSRPLSASAAVQPSLSSRTGGSGSLRHQEGAITVSDRPLGAHWSSLVHRAGRQGPSQGLLGCNPACMCVYLYVYVCTHVSAWESTSPACRGAMCLWPLHTSSACLSTLHSFPDATTRSKPCLFQSTA